MPYTWKSVGLSVNPARAGMIPDAPDHCESIRRKPRASGDDPVITAHFQTDAT